MPGLVPGIHAVLSARYDVDGRDKPGHDDVEGDEHIAAMFDASLASREVGRCVENRAG